MYVYFFCICYLFKPLRSLKVSSSESFLDVKLEAEFANKRVSETPETKLNIIGNVPEACPYLYNSNIQEPKQPNQIISNFTGNLPIHFAAQNGQLNVIKYLINQQGSGINPRNRYGFTPLHLAAENGNFFNFTKKKTLFY